MIKKLEIIYFHFRNRFHCNRLSILINTCKCHSVKNILSANNLSIRNRCWGFQILKCFYFKWPGHNWNQTGGTLLFLSFRDLFWRSDLPLGFHITLSTQDSQPARPECAPQSVLSIKIAPHLPLSSFHTDLGGGKDQSRLQPMWIFLTGLKFNKYGLKACYVQDPMR